MTDDTIETQTIVDTLTTETEPPPKERETLPALELEEPVLGSAFKAAPPVSASALPTGSAGTIPDPPSSPGGLPPAPPPPTPPTPTPPPLPPPSLEVRAVVALEKQAEAHMRLSMAVDSFERTFRDLTAALELIPVRIYEYIEKKFHGT
jgi:hypothetical protein